MASLAAPSFHEGSGSATGANWAQAERASAASVSTTRRLTRIPSLIDFMSSRWLGARGKVPRNNEKDAPPRAGKRVASIDRSGAYWPGSVNTIPCCFNWPSSPLSNWYCVSEMLGMFSACSLRGGYLMYDASRSLICAPTTGMVQVLSV